MTSTCGPCRSESRPCRCTSLLIKLIISKRSWSRPPRSAESMESITRPCRLRPVNKRHQRDILSVFIIFITDTLSLLRRQKTLEKERLPLVSIYIYSIISNNIYIFSIRYRMCKESISISD